MIILWWLVMVINMMNVSVNSEMFLPSIWKVGCLTMKSTSIMP